MTTVRNSKVFWIVLLLIPVLVGAAAWGAFQSARPSSVDMTAMLPQGALLTIEAQDFGGLLKEWSSSKEKAAWITSNNYGFFSRSRLFDRLNGAQTEFAGTAGIQPDMDFLKQVAGRESIFAWYDIGNLEFLYITHLPSGAAMQTQLLEMREKFQPRRVGNETFYVQTAEETHRTVAFAVSGDLLLLATREDLMAGALKLIASKDTSTSLAGEKWFEDARAAAPKDKGVLRMSLNLEKIMPTPYFRSYWVQRNIREMKQYRSAVADLHTDAAEFREERVLLPKTATTADGSAVDSTDLRSIVALVPAHAGMYRAVANPSIDSVISQLDEKLLSRSTGSYSNPHLAPVAGMAVTDVGSASDFETRIDAVPITVEAKGSEFKSLRETLSTTDLKAVMTVSRTGPLKDGIWVPFESAIVLSSAKGWDVTAMQTALQKAMGARLTASELGLNWKLANTMSQDYFEISETRPLQMAVRGNFCILTDDSSLMVDMLSRLSDIKPRPEADAAQTTLMAGFDPTQERAAFARWSKIVDRMPSGTAVGDGTGEPAFFSQNMRSLSDSFGALEGELVVERRDGPFKRQTVTYVWQH